eukprot:TRINITY_DN30249_c0_g1_i1.p1 TRINITY_DN30249_c0_g1~~TRINITY_DN30249_c0_g1_i1.p1  ORF type:complete len:648 (-),score=68.10 TRINITY_DN30249_c0_g1_i1:59-2002(-)
MLWLLCTCLLWSEAEPHTCSDEFTCFALLRKPFCVGNVCSTRYGSSGNKAVSDFMSEPGHCQVKPQKEHPKAGRCLKRRDRIVTLDLARCFRKLEKRPGNTSMSVTASKNTNATTYFLCQFNEWQRGRHCLDAKLEWEGGTEMMASTSSALIHACFWQQEEAKCANHPACRHHAGLSGLCCPTSDGISMKCCGETTENAFPWLPVLVPFALFVVVAYLWEASKPAMVASKEYPASDDLRLPASGGKNLSYRSPERLQELLQGRKKFIICFANPGSGDQKGKQLLDHLAGLLGNWGKALCLPLELEEGMEAAAKMMKEGLEPLILVCGGDGTVSWILTELQKRRAQTFPDVLPAVGIVPMGTGNDLARLLGWGAALVDFDDLYEYLLRMIQATPVNLDQWQLTLRTTSWLPPSLRPSNFDGRYEFVGYFTNYFSVGMDAHTTYGVARARDTGIGRCCFRSRCPRPCNFVHGGLMCYAMNAPNILRCLCCRVRSLTPDLEVTLNGIDRVLDRSCRQFTLTNLNSYGAGMSLYSTEAFEHVSPHDGKLEVHTLQTPRSVFGMVAAKKVLGLGCSSCSIPILTQIEKVEIKLRGGQYFQMDGEPWILNSGCTAIIGRSQSCPHVRVLCPPDTNKPGTGIWTSKQKRSFWIR